MQVGRPVVTERNPAAGSRAGPWKESSCFRDAVRHRRSQRDDVPPTETNKEPSRSAKCLLQLATLSLEGRKGPAAGRAGRFRSTCAERHSSLSRIPATCPLRTLEAPQVSPSDAPIE